MFKSFGWSLLAPAALSVLYGWTFCRAVNILGGRQSHVTWEQTRLPLFFMLLFMFWIITGFPLPILYILVFSIQLFLIKNLLLVNLLHLLSMALHMILISCFALITSAPMNELLQDPGWRIVTTSIILAVDSLMTGLLPNWKLFTNVLRTQMDSEEIAPFMTFLWFCNGSLLTDSILCLLRIDWVLLPLFLLGSTLLMEGYLLRFIRHLSVVLTAKYLEAEHQQLREQLTLQKRKQEKLRSTSEHDTLTRIYSRWYALEQMEHLLKEHTPFSLVYIDLDHLKQVNDTEGHQAGDNYLKHFAEAIRPFLRESDTFARIGGDEFVVLLMECEDKTATERMKHIQFQLCETISPPLPFSFGVVFVPAGFPHTVEQILHLADQAMYRDKSSRR